MAIVFDRLLLDLSSHLPGTPVQGASLLLSQWWPVFSLRVADTMAIHTYFGAPSLSNHVLNLPLLQSFVFSLLRSISNPVLAANLTLVASLGLTASLTTLYLQRRGIPLSAAALAGAALVLSPWYVSSVEGGDMIAASFWVLPLALWMLDRWLESPTTINAGLVIVTAYGSVLAGVPTGMWLLTIWLPYAVWRILALRGDEQTSTRHDQVVVIVLVLLGLLMLYPAPPLIRTLLGDEPGYGSAWAASDRSLIGVMFGTSLPIMASVIVTVLIARQQRKHLFWLAIGGFCLLVGVTGLPDR